MRIHRFFIAEQALQKGEFTVSDKNLLNQWRNVLRMKIGDKVMAFDGSGDEALCEFRVLDKKSATLLVLGKERGFVPECDITLFMSLIKRDNFELVLEKATELGVSRIVPVVASRSEKKGLNRERCEKILREASEQSGRATVPILDGTFLLKNIFDTYKDPIAVFDPRGIPFVKGHEHGPQGFVIGPEGGFTEDEIEFFKMKNVPVFAMGQTILRAETAAIVACALVLV